MAQGDSWADPIIIGENAETPAEVWADFLSKAWSGTAGQCMRFKDIHTTISGTGTVSDPYQVSTYHEMLTATGASYIWQCKLIDYDEESPTAIRTYIYDDGETVKYCAFDPTPTTIDFNDIYEEYITPIETNCKIDVNGWTWLNLRVNCSQTGAFFAKYDYNNSESYYANLILLNCQMAASGNDIMSMFSARFDKSIIQADVAYDGSGNLYWYYSNTSSNHNFYKCAVKLKINAPNATVYACAYSGTMYARDSTLDFDIIAGTIANRAAYFDTENCVFKGNVNSRNMDYFFGANHNTIFDISDVGGSNLIASLAHNNSVFNKNKLGWSDSTGLIGVTSEQLLSPTALQAAGLSIGVDT